MGFIKFRLIICDFLDYNITKRKVTFMNSSTYKILYNVDIFIIAGFLVYKVGEYDIPELQTILFIFLAIRAVIWRHFEKRDKHDTK